MKKIILIVAVLMIAAPAFADSCARIDMATVDGIVIYRITGNGEEYYRDSLLLALSSASKIETDCEQARLRKDQDSRETLMRMIRDGLVKPEWERVRK